MLLNLKKQKQAFYKKTTALSAGHFLQNTI